ncbi:POP4 [Hirschfeldia incana]|nr:POP4 [Hirschfeldia incana]KAJ0258430.1 POP4 [Hirschfeldia incana]
MATETVVHDPRKRSMDAIQQRLQKDQLRQQQQQQQQQQKNEKDKKVASSDDVNVSSKDQHKPHSLQTPPTKRPITTKDPQDDGFAAYTKLSHPVDEKLMATNVKLSSGKKNIADKVLHTLLRSGDSAQKYLQGKNEKKVEENNYILLDNFVQSSSSSKKAALMNSKRSKTRMSMKRLKKSGALNLPQHLQKFDLYKPMHGMWESYMMKLIKVTGKAQLASNLLSADLHGAFMFVAECKIASFTGVQGIMVRETSQTFGIITRDDKLRVVPKKPSVFIIQLDCWKITLHGDKFTSRDNVLQR